MRSEYTVELVAQILADKGLIGAQQHEEVVRKGRVMHSTLVRRLYGNQPQRHEAESISPAEVIAAMRLPDPSGNSLLDEDRIVEAVAQGLGIPYRKIDKLKLDMKLITEAISRPFAERHAVLPLALKDDLLTVAVADPFDTALVESLAQSTGHEIRPVLSSRTDIVRVIAEIYGFRKTVTAALEDAAAAPIATVDIGNFEQLFHLNSLAELEANEKHVVNAVDYLFHYALDQQASDIHIEPKRSETQVRMRIDGVLHNLTTVPRAVHTLIVSRLKIMARMDIAEKRMPQDGRIKLTEKGREVELRVSTMPVAFGEKMVIRIFDPQLVMCNLEELGMFPRELRLFHKMIRRPNGLVIVTGPTGSGKTTTMYSALRELASPEVNIVTIEDPVEMVYELFNQITVQPRLDLTFAAALRSVLRQDPDIIMLGEIRDPETAQGAIQAALTGHLVLTTLHTNDSVSAISRLVELKVPRYLISSTVVGVVAQRLVRRICPSCKTPARLTTEQTRALGLNLMSDETRLSVYRGMGCNACRDTGLKGRTGVYEMFEVTDRVRALVNQEVDDKEIGRAARAESMMTLRECALKNLAMGLTSFEEVLRVTVSI